MFIETNDILNNDKPIYCVQLYEVE